jgi:hypothetical protein
MESVANKSEALSLLGARLTNVCIFTEVDVREILEAGFRSLDECEEINGVYYYSCVQILNVVASAIWLKFYNCGVELHANGLMAHAINSET